MKKLIILLVLVFSLILVVNSVDANVCGGRSIRGCGGINNLGDCNKACDPGTDSACQWTGTVCEPGPGCGSEACQFCEGDLGGTCTYPGLCNDPGETIIHDDACCKSENALYICCDFGEPPAPEFNTFGIIAGIIVIGAAVFWFVKKKKK